MADRVRDVRKTFEAALDKMTPAKAQQLARSLLEGDGASKGKEQVSKLAHELSDWSQRNRDRVMEMVRREVRTQLKSLGVASKDELDSLKRRVRELEKATGVKRTTSRTTAKRTTKRSTAKRTTTS